MLDAACDPVLAYSARGGPKDLGRKTAVGARDEAGDEDVGDVRHQRQVEVGSVRVL